MNSFVIRRRRYILSHIRKGQGKELFFLHGWGCSKECFARAFELKGFCVTCVDLFGFGASSAPVYPVNLDYYATAVSELMQFYNAEDVVLIGHSFGGRICLKLAQNSRVGKIVLVDSAGLRPRRGVKYYSRVVIYKLTKLVGKPKSKGSSDYSQLSGAMKKTFINIVNEDLSFYAKAVPCPVLLIWGAKDKETPIYMLKRLMRLIPNNRAVIFEGCGHFAYLEQADRFYGLISEFAREI